MLTQKTADNQIDGYDRAKLLSLGISPELLDALSQEAQRELLKGLAYAQMRQIDEQRAKEAAAASPKRKQTPESKGRY